MATVTVLNVYQFSIQRSIAERGHVEDVIRDVWYGISSLYHELTGCYHVVGERTYLN